MQATTSARQRPTSTRGEGASQPFCFAFWLVLLSLSQTIPAKCRQSTLPETTTSIWRIAQASGASVYSATSIMMMETPAKRLRVLRSVEVDETNPEYVEAKQKQQQMFKSRLEKIFDKYGSMHESMSDEIDFKTGKVVVDRGHIRRIQRRLTRSGPTLVDNFLSSALEEDSNIGEDEERAGSEDELAPTQTLKRKRDSVDASKESAQSPAEQNPAFLATPQLVPTTLMHSRIPNTPNPATSLLEGIQFPQTPLGQQAQAAFVANLNQTIVQAVQQVVAPLFGILQNTANAQAPEAHLPVPALHLSPNDAVRPAADPRWYFPPIPAPTKTPQSEHPKTSPPVVEAVLSPIIDEFNVSSPLVTRQRSPKVHIQKRVGMLERKRNPRASETNLEKPESSHSLPTPYSDASSCPASKSTVETTLGHTIRKSQAGRKYHFTEEDDVYISQSRRLHNMTFKDIQRSKTKWSHWPASAFCNRWNHHLKVKRPSQQTAQECLPASAEHEEHFFSSIEIPETSSAEHHLPTPSSLEQEIILFKPIAVPSSSHFDDDELELLSLADADISNVQPMCAVNDDEYRYPAPDDPLPSIEGADFRNEDELQRDLQEELQREMLKVEDSLTPKPSQPKLLPSTIPETQESVLITSPPSQKHKNLEKSKPRPIAMYRASSNLSDDLDLIGADDEPATPHVHIKRESITPQATRILCSSPMLKTPYCIPQSLGLAKSTGKLNRRAFLNDVKKGWAKGNGKTPGLQKRKSLNILPRATKRAQVDIEAGESEDELAV
ncbi:myb-like DNA-binding domain protein [Stagonosporopsis vannaccii]|nr:myb-like DNA-binding domain protein [Stagonosporopsis vannaccii]